MKTVFERLFLAQFLLGVPFAWTSSPHEGECGFYSILEPGHKSSLLYPSMGYFADPPTLSKRELEIVEREQVVFSLDRKQFDEKYTEKGWTLDSKKMDQIGDKNGDLTLSTIRIDSKQLMERLKKQNHLSFPNLRSLEFWNYGSAQEDSQSIETFLKKFFSKDKKNFFPSLFSIDLGEVSKVTFDTVSQIHQHFLGYDYFVRDAPQYYPNGHTTAAFLKIEVGIENFSGDIYKNWRYDHMSDDRYPILHRRINRDCYLLGPLITTVHS